MITTSKRATLAAAAGLAGVALLAPRAFAYSEAVTSACTGDYLTYCSAYDENSAKGAQCMRAVAAKTLARSSTLSLRPRSLEEPGHAALDDQALRLPAYVELGGSVSVEHPLEKKERRHCRR